MARAVINVVCEGAKMARLQRHATYSIVNLSRGGDLITDTVFIDRARKWAKRFAAGTEPHPKVSPGDSLLIVKEVPIDLCRRRR